MTPFGSGYMATFYVVCHYPADHILVLIHELGDFLVRGGVGSQENFIYKYLINILFIDRAEYSRSCQAVVKHKREGE